MDERPPPPEGEPRTADAAFRHAMRHELHPSNPIANVRQVRKRATDPSILEPAEIVAILHRLEAVEPVRTAFLIAAVMGMRRGEIFSFKWADLDFDRAVWHIRRSYVAGVVGPPKTESSRRPLPLPPQAIEALTKWKAKSSYTWHSLAEERRTCNPSSRYRQAETRVAHAAKELRFPAPIDRSKPKSQYGAYAALHGRDDACNIRSDCRDEKREAGEKVASLVLVKKENAA